MPRNKSKTKKSNFCFLFKEGKKNLVIIFAPGGLLAGNCNSGSFNNLSSNGYFWSSVQSGSNAWNRKLNSSNATVNRNTNSKAYGFSVRCLKNWFLKANAPNFQLKFKQQKIRISAEILRISDGSFTKSSLTI